MVDPVDPGGAVARLAALARQLASAQNKPLARKPAGDAPAATGPAATAELGRARSALKARIQALGQDPRGRRLAARLLVESLLSETLGQRLVADAGFQRLVDDVLAGMEDDPAVKAELDHAVQLLLSARR